MSCKSCQSANEGQFGGEMGIHFVGLKNLGKPTVWVFPRLSVCLDCGFAEFKVANPEREELRALSVDQDIGTRRAV